MFGFKQYLGRIQYIIGSIPSECSWLENTDHTKHAKAFSLTLTIIHIYRGEQNLPITTLIEGIREMIQHIYIQRSDFGGKKVNIIIYSLVVE